jgi:hypothetical protein
VNVAGRATRLWNLLFRRSRKVGGAKKGETFSFSFLGLVEDYIKLFMRRSIRSIRSTPLPFTPITPLYQIHHQTMILRWYHRAARKRKLRPPCASSRYREFPQSLPQVASSLLVTCHSQRLAGRATRNSATGTRFHPHIDRARVTLTLRE